MTGFGTLVGTEELIAHIDDPNWVVVDCRFSLDEPAWGWAAYLASHIPGAVYAHLDEDLSGAVITGTTGNHPLPAVDAFAKTLSVWGVDERVQVVAYDDAGGVFAGRLWWMLRWLGHDKVALLDGDWRKWTREARTTRSGPESRAPRVFTPHPRPEMAVSVVDVLASLEDDQVLLADARDEESYRGSVESPDPVGHIPGAIWAWYMHHLNEDGTWRSPAELRAYYEALLGNPDSGVLPDEVIFYCGSGVSAAHNILAMQAAGLGAARLYVGSWSQWRADPGRPMAIAEE